ncbi:copper chaperone PCu(A)C [Aurantiacibacter rhizosphaerae]|uniref:Copper chaperone PCu(A)C n=1 Tax=Aurantiacibacter rhizosphaerae TaxID=2691582 RepID=A0A844XDU9_9SPHN|nr:copper chaperone PCu(A)C [Aurantiacibacter rhizosphaerae]MWV28010.1 copper chaperone PCu(A)C [Aurantiacibacter rhizosphaerae]
MMITKSISASMMSLGLALVLTACGGEATQEAPQDTQATADTDCAPGVAVTNGWLALGAVEGNPAAVYFDLENTGATSRMIRSASVMGFGSAQLHQMGEWNLQPSMDELMQLDVPAGETVKFEPGSLHVMAMEPQEPLEVGSETETTLTFVGGDKCSFPVEVRAAGDEPMNHAEGEHDGMDHAE